MSFETTTPTQARSLLETADHVYLDVRSVPEFEQGHPTGAFNIPLAHLVDAGMQPNPEFARVVQQTFGTETKIVVGCAAGGRSARACEVLVELGFTGLVNMHGGYSGARDGSGAVLEQGWEACGFPTATEAPAERCYAVLEQS